MVAENSDGAWVDGQQRRLSDRGKAHRSCGGGEAGRGTTAERGRVESARGIRRFIFQGSGLGFFLSEKKRRKGCTTFIIGQTGDVGLGLINGSDPPDLTDSVF